MHFRPFISAVLLLGMIIAFSSNAQAMQHQYAGQHPIAKKHGGGYCYIEFPHIHSYAPDKANLLYREEPEGYFFVGDPVAHGYDGETHAYNGAHPIHVADAVVGVTVETPHVVWCYLKGPHFHAVPPSSSASFEAKGDVYWYVGEYPPEFEAARPVAVRINAVYEPIHYHRPVVVVQPPTAYVDVFVSAPVIVGPPAIMVGPPSAVIVGPAPPFMMGPGPHGHGRFKGHGRVKGHGPFKGHGQVKGHGRLGPGKRHGGPGGHGGFKGHKGGRRK